MKFKYILTLLIITNFAAVAQQTIFFEALLPPYNILTREDVEVILAEEWDGDEFIADISPDVTVIGKMAFFGNNYLVKANTNNVETLDTGAFAFCTELKILELPVVIRLEKFVFDFCYNISVIAFGTEFTAPTHIYFESGIFIEGTIPNTHITNKIDLILGEFVLPKPDIEKREWQSYYGDQLLPDKDPYYWKSIKIFVGVEDKIENENIFCIGKNIYSVNDVSTTLELYDIMGNKLATFNNQDIIDLNDIKTSGTYFLSYIRKSKLITYKILIY